MEILIKEDNLEINKLNLDEMDVYWEKAKKILKEKKTV